MTEHPTVKVARDLRLIVDMTTRLEAQAIAKANDALMPGGLAMVALGTVAAPSAYADTLEAAEHMALAGYRAWPEIEDDDDWEPCLQTLLFWSEQLRAEHGYPMRARPTEATEANFLREMLDWLWEHEPHFDDFAADVRKAKGRLEALLVEGDRADRSRVVCPDCENPPRLIRVWGANEITDAWKCPRCKRRLDDDDHRRAYAKQLRSVGAHRFVALTDAIGTLRAQGRPSRTVRKWLEECRVNAYCDRTTHQVFAWWPDLWVLHLTTPTRKRAPEAVEVG